MRQVAAREIEADADGYVMQSVSGKTVWLPAGTALKNAFPSAADGQVLTVQADGTIIPENTVGLPSGGSTGQALLKLSNTDYDYAWGDTAGSGGGNQPGFLSGEIYSGTWNTSTTTGTLTAGILTLHPFLVPAAVTLNLLRTNVTVSGAGVVRLGIYASGATNLPGALSLDAGTVSAATAGTKDLTISKTLSAGLYWLASLQEVAGGTWTFYSGTMSSAVLGQYNRMQITGVASGALPSSAAAAVGITSASGGLRVQARAA